MNLQAKEKGHQQGLYVHVPFCASTCDFCNFYQKKPRGDDFQQYLNGIDLELEYYPKEMAVGTIFWGGGTPGLLGPREMERLGELIHSRYQIHSDAEWTVEMAPAFVSRRKLEALRSLGVNRISLGVQSFDPATLEDLGRQHTREQVLRSIEYCREAGFENWNLDLIFGSPKQDLAQWRADLEAALQVEPAHISTYCLTFEEDTALYLKLAAGEFRKNVEREAEFYEMAWQVLEEHGFAQYEVSNFARPGFACTHNLNTWDMQDWIGLGPSAASQYDGHRSTNIPDFDAWMEGLRRGRPERIEVLELTPLILAQDALIFGLRTNDGVDLKAWESRFGFQLGSDAIRDALAFWEQEGWIEDRLPQRLQLTLSGRLLADRLGSEILDWPLEAIPV